MVEPKITSRTLQNGHPNAVYGVAFSPDGRQLASASLDNHVKVDYHLRGCPPTHDEFIRVIESLRKKSFPEEYEKAVCVECREKGNPCLLANGQQCLGPVTCGGCDALCTSKGIVCYGCRGPVKKANMDRLVRLFEKRGLTARQIAEMFMIFAGTSKF